MKLLCTICARGGSIGIENKNIINLCGKPLIAYSILQAKNSNLFDVIAVSSDSTQILAIAKDWGADYLIERPSSLATATAAKIPAIRHALQNAENNYQHNFDIIVDLDATSPLRNVEDIHEAVNLLTGKCAHNVITGTSSRHSPYFNMIELDEQGVAQLAKISNVPVIRRQDTPPCYDMNASIYAWQRNILISSNTLFNDKTLLHIMPPERSVDIDSELDLEIVKLIMSKRNDLVETV